MGKTVEAKIPENDVRFRVDPSLRELWESQLRPYKGEKLEKALKAILTVRGSGFIGSWDDLVVRYDEAIKEAVA